MSTQKVAIVTGSNKGIGYGIVQGLCEKYNGVVYLTARDVGRGEAAVKKLKELGLNPLFHQLDITDQSSVDKLRDYIKSTHGGIDLLINNAAIAFQTKDNELGQQAEETMEVNYFSTLRVTKTLHPLLRNNAKVINISSGLGRLSMIPSAELRAKFLKEDLTIPELNKLMEKFVQDVKDGKHKEEGWGHSIYITYVITKVGLTALSFLQQKLFDQEVPNRNISVNAVDPGYVATDLNNHAGILTIEEGARTPLYVALEADFKGKLVWSDGKIMDWTSDIPKIQLD